MRRINRDRYEHMAHGIRRVTIEKRRSDGWWTTKTEWQVFLLAHEANKDGGWCETFIRLRDAKQAVFDWS